MKNRFSSRRRLSFFEKLDLKYYYSKRKKFKRYTSRQLYVKYLFFSDAKRDSSFTNNSTSLFAILLTGFITISLSIITTYQPLLSTIIELKSKVDGVDTNELINLVPSMLDNYLKAFNIPIHKFYFLIIIFLSYIVISHIVSTFRIIKSRICREILIKRGFNKDLLD